MAGRRVKYEEQLPIMFIYIIPVFREREKEKERERGSINYSNSITESHRVRKRDNVSLIAYFFENFVFSVTLLRWHW